MTRTTKYVAFDVHQATTVTSVREVSGRVLAHSVLEPHGPSIVEFLRGMRGDRPGTGTRAIRSMPTSCPSCSGGAGCGRSITGGRGPT